MRIFDESNQEIKNPDLTKGYFEKAEIVIRHPKKVSTEGHAEVIDTLPDGGKVIAWVNSPANAEEFFEEKEDILIYKKYTDEELANKKADVDMFEKLTSEVENIKNSSSLTEDALLELAESSNSSSEQSTENEAAILDLTEYVSSLEQRIAELEEAKGKEKEDGSVTV